MAVKKDNKKGSSSSTSTQPTAAAASDEADDAEPGTYNEKDTCKLVQALREAEEQYNREALALKAAFKVLSLFALNCLP